MRHKRFRASSPVVCDRCGGTIEEGAKALLRYDEKRGRAYFYHAHCPIPGEATTNHASGGCRGHEHNEKNQE